MKRWLVGLGIASTTLAWPLAAQADNLWVWDVKSQEGKARGAAKKSNDDIARAAREAVKKEMKDGIKPDDLADKVGKSVETAAKKEREDVQKAVRQAASRAAKAFALEIRKAAEDAAKQGEPAEKVKAAVEKATKDHEGDVETAVMTALADVQMGLSQNKRSRVRVTLYKMPPTRTYCTFDAEDGGSTVTVQWDPLRPGGLAREVPLDRGKQRVTCHAEPARHAIEPKVNFAWEFVSLQAQANGTGWLNFKKCSGLDGATCKEDVLGVVEPIGLPSIRPEYTAPDGELPSSKLNIESTLLSTPSAAALGGAQRAFGGVPEEALGELFQVIAEVAVEKARGKAMKLLEKRVTALVCEELKSLDGTGKPLLPKTCDALRHIRLEDLAGAGHQILDALEQDFVQMAIEALFKEEVLKKLVVDDDVRGVVKGFEPVAQVLVSAAIDAMQNRQDRVAGAGPRILLALSKVEFSTKDHCGKRTEQAIRIAFAIAAEVQHAGKIDAARIREMIEHADEHFDGLDLDNLDGATRETAVKELRKVLTEWRDLPAIISAAAHVLSPSQDTTEVGRLRAVIGIAFDILDFYLAHAKVDKHDDARNAMARARTLLDAAVQQDLSRAVTASASLIGALVDKKALTVDEGQRKLLQKVTALGGAVGAYMSTYASGQKPSAEELKARHDARKAAVVSLMDSEMQRKNRVGSWIVSVGATLGATAGSAWLTDKPANSATSETLHLQPALTAGLALDYHAREPHGGSHTGFHLQLAPVNLGNYLTVRGATVDADKKSTKGGVVTPSAADALSPSVTAGMSFLLPDADLIVLLGLTGGYSFKAGNETSATNRGMYFGGTLGVYLPIFDFN